MKIPSSSSPAAPSPLVCAASPSPPAPQGAAQSLTNKQTTNKQTDRLALDSSARLPRVGIPERDMVCMVPVGVAGNLSKLDSSVHHRGEAIQKVHGEERILELGKRELEHDTQWKTRKPCLPC